ncbi:HNH endonuclease domain protein, partial [Yersinia pestis PY-89]
MNLDGYYLQNGNLSPIAPKPYGKPPLSHMTKPQLRPPVVVLLMAL